ncbi:linalool dehydratase/isomerase domain-containing protein [Kutzneria sp. CA-103260]|uniref:linalool dehydratase/isomerase domain-containing protein n=1 Tax=Kutzneria sp. CA-103260 TaxID=2802641 RepID=UPI001BAE4609|nr:hypothetical protein [Kutzneria sp. CA-103260]QUQ66842.1 Linalool dehydratase/isomerase [Kutzneria sp. CA-103260]
MSTTLTAEQLGHLRHFDNLSRQLPNDWSLMQGKGTNQEDFGGYRFQLAYMAYALALTHRHRLPAAPGLFQPIMQRLIDKIMHPEVWMYWRDVSRGGSVYNAHLVDEVGEQWDPVVRDNIMYSAYVQSMALLHDYLFDSDRYAAEGSLTFGYWSFFWGGEPREFPYDRNSLNEHIYWQMVGSGYLGVACEPNCVFQICNQPAILGFRLHDLITGGRRAEEVVAGYEQAWRDFGRLDETGRYNMMVLRDSQRVLPNARQLAWVDAWCGALMNMWNRDFVRANYPRQVANLVHRSPAGTLSVAASAPQEVMGQTVVSDTCDFGWVAAWASEMGDEPTLRGLLDHVDQFMNPTWRDGGLYYPRNDTKADPDGNRVEMEPMTGNVLIGYARLNVPDGLWGLYNQPWDRSRLAEPALTAVDRNVDVSRAEVVDGVLHTRLRRAPGLPGDGTVTISRLTGRWTVDDQPLDSSDFLRVDGDNVVLRCPDEARTFTFRREP